MGQHTRYYRPEDNARGCISVLADSDYWPALAGLGFVETEAEALAAKVDPPKVDGDLLARAKELKIKGAHLMSPDTLRAAIAKAEA